MSENEAAVWSNVRWKTNARTAAAIDDRAGNVLPSGECGRENVCPVCFLHRGQTGQRIFVLVFRQDCFGDNVADGDYKQPNA